MIPYSRFSCKQYIDFVPIRFFTSILLFESMGVVWMLILPASQPNHPSFKKFVFTEFVQNSWGYDIDMVIFDLQPHGGC